MPTDKFHPWTTVYDMDYFNSSQTFVYIGDVLVDEVTTFQYRTSQHKTPIYGYASQLWDEVAEGLVIVEGSFTINFKEQGYLWAVLRRYHNIAAAAANVPVNSKKDALLRRKQAKLERSLEKKVIPGAVGNKPLVGSNGTQISRATIERLAQGDATTGERYEFYHDLAGYATFGPNSSRDKVFEDVVEVFEDEIWSTKTNTDLNNQLRRVDDSRFDGFDVYIVFGDYSSPKANHTVHKLTDVRLTSSGKMVRMDAMPIQEEYTFIARSSV